MEKQKIDQRWEQWQLIQFKKVVVRNNVITEEPDIVAVQYDNFHALSIKAIQELLDKVEKLESRILELEKL